MTLRRQRAHPETGLGKAKLVAVGVLFALIWAALLTRTGYIQLYKGAQYAELASKQTLSTEFERGQRGRILDRDGNLLASTVEAKSVYIHPFKVKDKAAAVKLLAEALDLSSAKISKLLSSKKSFVWVKRQIKDREAAALAQAPMPGVYLTNEYVRIYPQGKLAGQVLGFVNIDGKGLEGLESKFDARMAGGKAEFVVQRDNLGRRLFLDSEGREMDIDGDDVALTIDSHVQALAERALGEAVTKNKAKAGIAVVVDIPSGDILALASVPFFNPNAVRSSAASQRRLRAALDVYEPGSTMKPLLFAAALEQGTIKVGDRIDCENGRYKVGPGWVRDHHPYGWLTVNEVLRYSSNIGSAKIAQDLGAQNYYWYLTRLGFGVKPNLPLSAISPGKLHPVEKWRKFDLAAAAFGHGIGVTALQLTQAYMTLACGGEMVPLKLLRNPAQPQPAVNKRVFSTQTVDAVMAMMREVVEMDGTARYARIPGVPMAGKTGTAQKPEGGKYSNEDYISSFVGMVPADHPEMLIVVMIDDPNGKVNAGGKVAAPAVREIAMGTLAYHGHLPAPPPPAAPVLAEGKAEGEAAPAPQPVAAASDGPVDEAAQAAEPTSLQTKRDVVPDVRGMPLRRALEVLARQGVVPLIKNNGVNGANGVMSGGKLKVSSQKPNPNEPWPEPGEEEKDDVFILWLS